MKNGREERQDGFTLVEVLIAMAVASIVGMVGMAVFSSSNWSYKLNEDVAEAQQNGRMAMERLSKDIRMAGFGLPDPPFSLTIDGNPLTAPATFTSGGSGASDSITLLGGEEEVMWLDSDADCSNSDAVTTNDCNLPDANDPNTSHASGTTTLNVTGNVNDDGGYAVDDFLSGGSLDPDRQYLSIDGRFFVILSAVTTSGMRATLTVSTPSSGLDRAYRDGTPVYIIKAFRYSISTSLTGCSSRNPCLARQDLASNNAVLAENIEDIQFAYGVDTNRDGKMDSGFQNSPSDLTGIVAVRASVLAMTRNKDLRGADVSKRPELEDHSEGPLDKYRRRLLTKILKVRNPKAG